MGVVNFYQLPAYSHEAGHEGNEEGPENNAEAPKGNFALSLQGFEPFIQGGRRSRLKGHPLPVRSGNLILIQVSAIVRNVGVMIHQSKPNQESRLLIVEKYGAVMIQDERRSGYYMDTEEQD